jgi:hypothetical protein
VTTGVDIDDTVALSSLSVRGDTVILDPSTLTGIHTLLSLAALTTGRLAVLGLFLAWESVVWTTLFLATATATSATGFLFSGPGFGPSHWVGVLSLIALLFAVIGRYGYRLAGPWRRTYAICVVIALYFLVFVAIAQAFAKAPALHALAPTGSEPPFAIAQAVALVLFAVVGFAAARAFRYRGAFSAR